MTKGRKSNKKRRGGEGGGEEEEEEEELFCSKVPHVGLSERIV